jgi:hypothetical protein
MIPNAMGFCKSCFAIRLETVNHWSVVYTRLNLTGAECADYITIYTADRGPLDVQLASPAAASHCERQTVSARF